MFVKQSEFFHLCIILCCGLISLVSGRIIKPSHGVPVPQYQQQAQTEKQYPQEHHHHQAEQPQATKHSIRSYHSHSGYDLQKNHDHHHTHPKYKYAYHVEDHKTGDYKRHSEERDGDVVHGEYSVIEADGGLRTIKYIVDKEQGFQTIVVKNDGKKVSN